MFLSFGIYNTWSIKSNKRENNVKFPKGMPQIFLTKGAPKLTRKERKKASIARRLMLIVTGVTIFSNLTPCNYVVQVMIVGGTGLQRQRHRSVCTSLYSLLYCTFQVLPFVLVSAFRLKRNISQPPDQLCTNFYIDTRKLSQPMICKQMTILIGCFDGRYVMICLHRASLQGQRLHTEGCR